jgi:hypothetical protein
VVFVASGAAFWGWAVATIRKWRRGNVSIKVIDTVVPDPDPNQTLTYPLKCYVEMRNESPQSVEVWIPDFDANLVTLKNFVSGVLQVKLDSSWCSSPSGVEGGATGVARGGIGI